MKIGLAIYAGGNHVFYILGALKFFFEKGLKFDAIGTYSSGSSILQFLINGKFDQAPEIFARYLDQNERNVYLRNIFNSAQILPHDQMYSRAINELLEFETIVQYNKPIRVIISEFQSRVFRDSFVGLCAFIALFLYELTKRATGSMFLKIFKFAFSIKGSVIDIRHCKSKEDMVNVILGSSTIYPFIHVRRRGKNSMLDGKMSLLSPIGVLHDCDYVLSVHAHDTLLPPRKGLFSVFPICKVKAGPLNYVGSTEIKLAFAQGYEEGKQHYDRLRQAPFFQ